MFSMYAGKLEVRMVYSSRSRWLTCSESLAIRVRTLELCVRSFSVGAKRKLLLVLAPALPEMVYAALFGWLQWCM